MKTVKRLEKELKRICNKIEASSDKIERLIAGSIQQYKEQVKLEELKLERAKLIPLYIKEMGKLTFKQYRRMMI